MGIPPCLDVCVFLCLGFDVHEDKVRFLISGEWFCHKGTKSQKGWKNKTWEQMSFIL